VLDPAKTGVSYATIPSSLPDCAFHRSDGKVRKIGPAACVNVAQMSQGSPGAAGAPRSAAALFRHPPFLLFFTARACSRFCYQIGAVAVGWQVYALTNSALDLGLIG